MPQFEVSVHLPEHPEASVGGHVSFDGATSAAFGDLSPSVRMIHTPPLMCPEDEPSSGRGVGDICSRFIKQVVPSQTITRTVSSELLIFCF